MAEVFGANVATRIGDGAAQIYDTSRIEAQIQRQIDQERKRQDLENQQISNQISKIKLDGIRQADAPIVTKAYSATQDAFNKMKIAESKNDKQGAIAARSELTNAQSDLMNKIQQSKAENQSRAIITHDTLNNKKDYIDNAFNTWNQSENKSTFDPDYRSAADVAKIQRKPEAIDLVKVGDEAAKLSTAQVQPHVIKEGGSKFDVTGTSLNEGAFKKALELEYVRSAGTQAAIDKQYDPANIPADQKVQIQSTTKEPLVTALDYYKQSEYLRNKVHYERMDRKQLTEKTPRQGAITVSLGDLGGNGDETGPISIATPVKTVVNRNGKMVGSHPSVETGSVTPAGSLTLGKNIKFDANGAGSLKNARTGEAINKPGAKTFAGSQLVSVPVWNNGYKRSGVDVGGNIVSDEDAADALSKGYATQKLVFQGQHGEAVGLDAYGGVQLTKDATPAYFPATNGALTAILLSQSKQNLPAVKQKIMELYQKTQEVNRKYSSGRISQPKTKSVSSSSSKKLNW